jgi:two-component system OmpR family sensor kinase
VSAPGEARPPRCWPGASRLAVRIYLFSLATVLVTACAQRELMANVSHELRTPQPVCVDPALLRRAVDNLLDNAGKYSEPGSPISLAAHRAGARVAIVVADRGIGIDEADREHLFTPFFRSDRSRARATGGFGLGLALARQIVLAHGGTISVASRVDEGTTVTLSLPVARLRE